MNSTAVSLTWIGIQINYHGHRGLVITVKLIIAAINTCAKEWRFIWESRIRSDIHFTQVVPIINEPTQRPEQKQTVVYTWWNFWRTYWEQTFSTTYWIAILFPNYRHCNGSVYNWWQWNCAIKRSQHMLGQEVIQCAQRDWRLQKWKNI